MPAQENPKSDLLQGTLDVLILKIVALGPVHGYAIAQRLQQISRDVLQVQQGSLYPALHRLEKRGRVRAEWAASETGRDARFYTLTREGRRQLDPALGGRDGGARCLIPASRTNCATTAIGW